MVSLRNVLDGALRTLFLMFFRDHLEVERSLVGSRARGIALCYPLNTEEWFEQELKSGHR